MTIEGRASRRSHSVSATARHHDNERHHASQTDVWSKVNSYLPFAIGTGTEFNSQPPILFSHREKLSPLF
ncbi:hypothetical protein CBS147346_6868 [Aspergillus niger]|nr:hypothetical protein CBS147346_6868 [Aspergillus niger]